MLDRHGSERVARLWHALAARGVRAGCRLLFLGLCVLGAVDEPGVNRGLALVRDGLGDDSNRHDLFSVSLLIAVSEQLVNVYLERPRTLAARLGRTVDEEWTRAVLLLIPRGALVDDGDGHVAISSICSKTVDVRVEPECVSQSSARYFRGSGGQSTRNGQGPFCCCSRRVALWMMVMVMVFALSSMEREKLPPERTGSRTNETEKRRMRRTAKTTNELTTGRAREVETSGPGR
jgi:hypothetical protein